MSEEKKDNPEIEIPPALAEFGAWLRENWFPVALIIALFTIIIVVALAVRRR